MLMWISVTNQARSMFRSISESPDVFGSIQERIRTVISTLIAVSSMTDEYSREGRLDKDSQFELVKLVADCQDTLSQLERLKCDFEKWGLQSVREEELLEMMNALDNQIQVLSAINSTIVY